jgi:hypothetical protein
MCVTSRFRPVFGSGAAQGRDRFEMADTDVDTQVLVSVRLKPCADTAVST